MTLKQDSTNYRIELIDGLYTIVCRSPYGSRCLKVLKNLSSDNLKDVEMMWEGYKTTSLKMGYFKK